MKDVVLNNQAKELFRQGSGDQTFLTDDWLHPHMDQM